MKNFYVLLALLSLLLMGCSKEDGTDVGGQAVQLAAGTSSEYTVYADQTTASPSQGITFTTTGPWRATVAETRAGADWVTISPDHGDQAGSYTITVSLEANTTGQDRKAVVTIECGDSKITITVEQKGTTESGELPQPAGGKKVVRMEVEYFYFTGSTALPESKPVYEFRYDEQGRLSNIVSDYVSSEGTTIVHSLDITYGDGTVVYDVVYSDNGVVTPEKDKGTATLDAEGRVVSGIYEYTYNDKGDELIEGSFTYDLSYDADGYLVKTVSSENGESRITWSGGNPVQVWWGTTGDGKDMIDYASYGDVLNQANLDLNWLCALSSEGWDFATGDSSKIFNLLGLVGKRSTHMAKSLSTYNGAGLTEQVYAYELDADGLPTKITSTTTDYGSSKKYVDSIYKIYYAE